MWHFIFGLLSVYYTPILILFLIYQVVKHNPISLAFAGLLEFFIGYVFLKCILLNFFPDRIIDTELN